MDMYTYMDMYMDADFINANIKRGHWEAVVENYAKNPRAQTAKVTREGNTVLHLAVIDNEEEIVERLVEIICRSENKKWVLECRNERGNNPLHLAAALGSTRMCHTIASAHQQLVDNRNSVGETPLFLAASYGNRNAFYCLYYFCRDDPSRATMNCRASTGDTVLHCALRNEHFDLAFQIIHLNDQAIHLVNEQGSNVLHVLASKPTCFKSGANISGWKSIVYNWIFIDQLKPESIESLGKTWKKCLSKPQKAPLPFPRDYKTCIQYFTRLSDAFLKVVIILKKSVESNQDKDLELGVNQEIQPERLQANQSVAGEPSMTKFPKMYNTCVDFFKIVFTAFMIILEFGFPEIKKIREKKQKHTWCVQVMEKLVELARYDNEFNDGRPPSIYDSHFPLDKGITLDAEEFSNVIQRRNSEIDTQTSKYVSERTEAAIHLAAKNGVIEIVMAIFERFPLAMGQTGESDGKNVVHLAAEHRQSEVYKFLLKKKYHLETLFQAVDKSGNSALHLAASRSAPKFWHLNGAALQMQWEVEWYKFVKESVPLHFFALFNMEGKTASTIFEESHMELAQKGNDWLYSTSQSCSLVATLIATVAFATAAIIPGSGNDDPHDLVDKERVSFIFAISSLIALSLSTTSVVMFLAILTAKFDMEDYFGSMFTWKLLVGLSTLYSSIIAMLVSFCTGSSYFLINHHFPNKAILIYTLTFLPVTFILALMHLPLYFDLLLVFLKIEPKRRVYIDLCD